MNPLLFLLCFSFLAVVHLAVCAAQTARRIALAYSIFLLFFSYWLLAAFDPTLAGFQFLFSFPVIADFNLAYTLAVDGISLWLIILTALLIPFCVLVSWEVVTYRVNLFYSLLFLIEFLLFHVFTVLDFLLFYISFEAILIPMFIIIGVWGSR